MNLPLSPSNLAGAKARPYVARASATRENAPRTRSVAGPFENDTPLVDFDALRRTLSEMREKNRQPAGESRPSVSGD